MPRRSMTTDDVLVQLLDSDEESLQDDGYENKSNFESEFRNQNEYRHWQQKPKN